MSVLAPEDSPDSLHNYDIHEEIGRGKTSIVYLATCRRGRMRNRLVAVKKTTSTVKRSASRVPLHLSLCHPSIVTFMSAFATGTAQYHVLELCINGKLQDFIQSRPSPTLHEDELRGVVKSLADVFLYLRKERIVHRDLSSASVLLNETFRLKLSDFGLAVRLPPETSTVTGYSGSQSYISPEIVARKPHGFPTDLWSLGCLMVTYLTGNPAFDGSSPEEIHDNISSASYDLPSNISLEVKDLINSLLQINPLRRISLEKIMRHPFLDPSLPVQPFSSSSSSQQCSPHGTILSPSPTRGALFTTHQDSVENDHHESFYLKESDFVQTESFCSADVSNPQLETCSDRVRLERFSSPFKNTKPLSRTPLANIGNFQKRISSFASVSHVPTTTSNSGFGAARRILSAPPSRAPSVVPTRHHPNTAMTEAYDTEPESSILTQRVGLTRAPLGQQPRSSSAPLWRSRAVTPAPAGGDSDLDSGVPGLSLCDSTSGDTLSELGSPSMSEMLARPTRLPTVAVKDQVFQRRHRTLQDTGIHANVLKRDGFGLRRAPMQDSEQQPHESPIRHSKKLAEKTTNPAHRALSDARHDVPPIGTIRPTALNTTYLLPQTHKVVKGQLTVLPSRSLLVDFREGERRKGQRGDEVLVVSPDGAEVKVYSAPHLSTPCCLAEPLAVHPVADLPQRYWKIYNDARIMVDEMKQRVPKLVLHMPDAQCILMANEPAGDIEVTMPPPNPIPRRPRTADRSSGHGKDASTSAKMRIRLFQGRHFVEISRYMSSGTDDGAGEWTKKIIPTSGCPPRVRWSDEEWRALEESEKKGVEALRHFVRVCEAVEGVPMGEHKPEPKSDGELGSKMDDSGLAQVSVTLDRSASTIKPQEQVPLVPQQRNEPRNLVEERTKLRPPTPPATTAASEPTTRSTRTSGSTIGHGSTPALRQSYELRVGESLTLDDPWGSQERRTCSRSRSIFTAATAATGSIPSVVVAPRPARFSRASRRTAASSGNKVSTSQDTTTTDSDSDIGPVLPPGTPQYRPNIGWCIRHDTNNKDAVHRPVRYSVLRPDGTSEEVDSTDERGGIRLCFESPF